jgi:hypothetical protein
MYRIGTVLYEKIGSGKVVLDPDFIPELDLTETGSGSFTCPLKNPWNWSPSLRVPLSTRPAQNTPLHT